ncbi:AraC family transcriptional regulator [Mesorhizobium sp. M1406]
MVVSLSNSAELGLGRLCGPENDGVYAAPASPGVERIAARFEGEAYSRHRHDTYAVGVTITGVQTFWYRGEQRVSLPGQIIVLHPDEVHDGGAGTEQPLTYRMAYVEPWLLQPALASSGSLPFLRDPVFADRELRSTLELALGEIDVALSPLVADQFVAELGDAFSLRAEGSVGSTMAVDRPALQQVREFITRNSLEPISSNDLELVSGLDRFALTRQFKALFGTSPHRYQIMRRLSIGRRLIGSGQAISDVAALTGFADQSHFHRHFTKAFGLTPGRWKKLATGRQVEAR